MKKQFSILSTLFFLLTWTFLLWAAATVMVEYYDAFDYLMSAKHLLGEDGYWVPKNALFILVLTLIRAPFLLLKIEPALIHYHLPLWILNLGAALAIAAWLRREFSMLPFLLLAAFATWNRIFIHFTPFANPDIFAALCISLWFWVDHSLPLKSWRGRLLRGLCLAAIVLGRPHTALIPLGHILWRIIETKPVKETLRPYAMSILLSIVIFAVTFSVFHAVGGGTGLIEGARNGFDFFLGYFSYVRQEGQAEPVWIPLAYLFQALGVIGTVLVVLGLQQFFAQGCPAFLRAPLFGSALYLVFSMAAMHKEGRYLTPLIPAWTALLALGIAFLLRQKMMLALIGVTALFISMIPELWHFTDPYYRADLTRKTSLHVAEWNRSPQVLFLSPMAAFYPKNHTFHWNDGMFYIQHWSGGALRFFTGIPSLFNHDPITFEQYGYPIADGFHTFAPQGVTMIMPSKETYFTVNAPPEIEPVYLLRWWALDNPLRGQTPCDPRVKDACVEVHAAMPGYRHGTSP